MIVSEEQREEIGALSSDAHAIATTYQCGGSGHIAPAAQKELDAFRVHVETHTHDVAGCRFCNARCDRRHTVNAERPV
jgi:hypothetical protein